MIYVICGSNRCLDKRHGAQTHFSLGCCTSVYVYPLLLPLVLLAQLEQQLLYPYKSSPVLLLYLE